ncbi:PilZ domain-containing protein [Shewanella submarina]|uniref:PilZ domain-containing protein n=1 Tax=Shewanella submarina TaxID=2016376 RepID=A0ABV7GD54_9GAMM|nr:PilZ domain-containing protein [Shewanella submarina]MCL1037198.1 PilZ domain-containing protein [Shewanella submarina]
MSIELQTQLIEQLKPLLKEEHFQEAFDHLTADESTSTRFLIKMELNRISAPCTRTIDLRDRSDLPCQEFQHGEQAHFLDSPSKEVFESSIALYQGEYTVGVYEEVIESFKARRQKQNDQKAKDNDVPQEEENSLLVPGIIMGNYCNRNEVRLTMAVKISASQLNGPELQGNTLDLSVNGARVKLSPANRIDMSKPIHVKLHYIDEEHLFDELARGMDYEIISSEDADDNTAVLRLKRVDTSVNLTNLLDSFISSYRQKYKLDINDIYQSAIAMGLERQYLPRLPHLPLYVGNKHNEPFISHMLLSQDNHALVNYFFDENDKSQMTSMLTPTRLRRIITEPKNPAHRLFFSFTHTVKGCIHFYSATLAELKAKKLLPLFLGFGAKKNGWRIFRIGCQKVDHNQPYRNASMPMDDREYSEMTEHKLSRISHVLELIDCTQSAAAGHYQAWFNDQDVNQLKIFAQRKVRSHQAQLVSLQFNERRGEARFAFKTLVTLTQGDKTCHAVTQNISGKGMQLTMDHPVEFDEKSTVILAFPKLQPLAGKVNLSNLPYRIVRTRKNGVTIHLAAEIGHDIHVGVEFIRRLIKHNADKLEQLTENNSEIKELADGMKNLLMRKLSSVPLFVEKTAKSGKLSALGIGPAANELTDMFAASSGKHLEFDLTPLFGEERFKQWVMSSIRESRPTDGLKTFEVFIEIARQPRGQVELYCYPLDELADRDEQLAMIQRCQRNGQFRALRLYIGAAAKPDMYYIRKEMDYITVQAPHKAKKVENMMWHLIGVGELLDITMEVQMRFPELHGQIANKG